MTKIAVTLPERIRLFFLFFLQLLCNKVHFPNISFTAHVLVEGKRCAVPIENVVDLWVFDEIFVQKQYETPEVSMPKTVLDIGANVGFASIYFALRYPEARIYSIEADPKTYERLRKNTAGFSAIVPIHAAVTSTDGGTITFFRGIRSVSSSLRRRSSDDAEVVVPRVSVDGICKRYGLESIDLCKFDVEGAEGEIFSIPDIRKKIMFCIGEIHEDLMQMSKESFMDFFPKYDIVLATLGDQRYLMRAKKE